VANPFRSSRRFGLGFKRVCGRPEATTTAPASEKKKQPALVYMSSCPFSDLVVVALIVAVVAVLLRALACSSRSMRQGLNGWNKSSSMLRSVRRSAHFFFYPAKISSFSPIWEVLTGFIALVRPDLVRSCLGFHGVLMDFSLVMLQGRVRGEVFRIPPHKAVWFLSRRLTDSVDLRPSPSNFCTHRRKFLLF
jgi:hypothetical protein